MASNISRCASVSDTAALRSMVGTTSTSSTTADSVTTTVYDDYESLPTNNVAIHMTAGAIAGIAEHSVTYPLDCIKTRMQSMVVAPVSRGVVPMMTHVVHTEGARVLFRGVGVVVVGAGPAHALYFASYEKLKERFEHTTQYKSAVHGASGAVATLLHDAFMNPVDVVKQRLQMHGSPYSGGIQCAGHIMRTEGFRAFYRSYSTQLTMNIPFQSTNFMVYEAVRKQLNPEGRYNPQVHLFAGGLAGAAAALVTNPLDVAKTVLNTQEEARLGKRQAHLTGMMTALKRIYQAHGMSGFYRGMRPRILHQAPATAICWSIYELFKSIMGIGAVDSLPLGVPLV